MVLELYPPIVYETAPTSFSEDVDAACNLINGAVKGFGTDEKALIATLADESQEMRYLIGLRYKQLFDKDLKQVMKSEVGSGDLGIALQLLCLPMHQAEAMMLDEAMSGIGAKKSCIYPILCGRTNKEMEKLKDTYFQMYEKDLGVKLASELRGDYERLIFWSLQGHEKEFDPTVHTPEQAKEDAVSFHEAGSGRFGTDERSLFKIISESPAEHLENVNRIYVDKYERSLLSALGDELKGDVGKGAVYAVGMKLKPFVTIAKLIKDATRGMGTNEDLLTNTVIRYQKFMKEVNDEHKEIHDGKSVQDRIKDECKRKYEKLLLAIVDSAGA